MPVGYPRGFEVTGVSSGIKPGGKRDLALIYSAKTCEAAAMFTTNTFAAAPVQRYRCQFGKCECMYR